MKDFGTLSTDRPDSGMADSAYVPTVQSEHPPSNSTATLHPLLQEMAVASICLLIFLVGLILVGEGLHRRKSSRSSGANIGKNVNWLRRLNPTTPCRRCHYFEDNRHLPCAVNPNVVLRPAAKNCTDFRPQ